MGSQHQAPSPTLRQMRDARAYEAPRRTGRTALSSPALSLSSRTLPGGRKSILFAACAEFPVHRGHQAGGREKARDRQQSAGSALGSVHNPGTEILPNFRAIDFNRRVFAYPLIEADSLTLIDTGIAGDVRRILDEVEIIWRNVKDIRQIVLTHCHKRVLGRSS